MQILLDDVDKTNLNHSDILKNEKKLCSKHQLVIIKTNKYISAAFILTGKLFNSKIFKLNIFFKYEGQW